MFEQKAEKWFQDLIRPAGITLNGQQPFDIQVHDSRMFNRILLKGFLGLDESYMDGQWDCQQPDELTFRLLRAKVDESAGHLRFLPELLNALRSRVINLQSKGRAFIVGQRHYDIGNDLYQPMLGKVMAYSCARFQERATLDQAQLNKYDLICRKLKLTPGSTILEIGCGWGTLAKYVAENFDCKVIGLTVSKEQAAYARELCAGLPVEILLMDYRDFSEQVDAIVSIGMIEHVGFKNYETYFDVARRCLKPDGLFLLHTIGSSVSTIIPNAWMEKYIFPNGLTPSLAQLAKAIEGRFVIEDIHNFGSDYAPTLMTWYRNFHQALDSGQLDSRQLDQKYSDGHYNFTRVWDFYLLSCAGAFRARTNQLYQLVLSPQGVLGGYESVR